MRASFLGIACAGALALGTGVANGGIVVSENFDSYADTAAMNVNWGSVGGLGTLDSGFGNGGKSASHPGGTVNSWIGSAFSITPSASENVVLQFDMYDDYTSTNERITVGLRNGADPLLEIGHYNGSAEHYHVRVLNFAGNENWVPLQPGLNASSGAAGWNRYTATISTTGITVTLDLGANGSVEGTFTSTGAPSANPFTDLRFGGPSNLSSAGGGAWFDNITLSTVAVPEPGSLALLGLGGLAMIRRRRA